MPRPGGNCLGSRGRRQRLSRWMRWQCPARSCTSERVRAVRRAGRNSLAAVNTANGAVTSWNPNVDGGVEAIAVSGSTVYVGGAFTTVSGRPHESLAAVDATSGAALTWNPNVGSIFGGQGVRALAVSGQLSMRAGPSHDRHEDAIPPSRPGRHHRARHQALTPFPQRTTPLQWRRSPSRRWHEARAGGPGFPLAAYSLDARRQRAYRRRRQGLEEWAYSHGPGGESARRSRVPMGELTEARGARARAAARLSPEAPQHLRALWPPRLRGSPALDRHSLVAAIKEHRGPSLAGPSSPSTRLRVGRALGHRSRGGTGCDG